jgi:hypothetical protein
LEFGATLKLELVPATAKAFLPCCAASTVCAASGPLFFRFLADQYNIHFGGFCCCCC